MIRKFLNWLFGKKQETNKYAPLPTLDSIPASHMAVSSHDDEDWSVWTEVTDEVEIEPGTLEAPVAKTLSTESVEQVKTETTHSAEEPKAIHNHKPKRKYHKKKHKH